MRLVLLFFLLVCFYLKAQNPSSLEGTYCNNILFGENFSCFDFRPDGQFTYFNSGCFGLYEYATGAFELKEDLVLNLEINERKGNHSISFVDRPEKFENKVVIRFTVTNELGSGFQSTIIRKGADLRDFVFEQNLTDSDGKLEWVIDKQDKKEVLDLDVIPGPENIFFEIDYSKSQEVYITIFSGRPDLNKAYPISFKLTDGLPDGLFIGDQRFFRRN